MTQENRSCLHWTWQWTIRTFQEKVLWGPYQFALYTRLRHWRDKRRFKAVADPYRQVRLDPQRIETFNRVLCKQWGLGQIVDGTWDQPQQNESFDADSIPRGLRQRFEDGYAWEDTTYYQFAKSEFEQDRSVWGYQTLDEFHSIRCEYVDSLYESIRSDGYRPNAAADHRVPQADTLRRRQAFVHQLEPLVVIGRNGTVHWRDGFHRIAIARILGIEAIPVQVLARHQEWQAVRDAISTGSTLPIHMDAQWTLGNHPDLQGLLPDRGDFKEKEEKEREMGARKRSRGEVQKRDVDAASSGSTTDRTVSSKNGQAEPVGAAATDDTEPSR